MDVEILAGATQALTHTRLVCVEANDETAERRVASAIGPRFGLVKRFGCNLLWEDNGSR